MLNAHFVIVGSIIVTLGALSYLIDTLKGKVKPNKVTFLLWSVGPMVVFFAEIKQGVGLQSLLPFTIGVLPFIIFLASFVNKKSQWKMKRVDFLCGALSVIGIILWYTTKSGNTAIFFSILADGLAGLPTVIKAFNYPETESVWGYFPATISGIITLLTVKYWNFANIGFPIYITVITGINATLIQFKIGEILKKRA